MANWYGLDRTNYFRVKDREAFLAFVKRVDGVTLCWPGAQVTSEPPADVTTFALYADDYSGWPSCDLDDNEIEFISAVVEHVADDDVIVFVSAGYENARYATGYACAFHKGEKVEISINDIYAQAHEAFGIEATPAEY